MICLNCGKDNGGYLCENCRTDEILHKIWADVYAKREFCDNVFVNAIANFYEDPNEYRKCIPEILKLFSGIVAEFYWCKYYSVSKDERFESAVLEFVDKYGREDERSQVLINSLLLYYGVDDFYKPVQWCQWILNTSGLLKNLYYNASRYYSRIGDYQYAMALVDRAEDANSDGNEKFAESLAKLRGDIKRYSTVKPYWPVTEERQAVISEFYRERGIKIPVKGAYAAEKKRDHVPESEFAPFKARYELPRDYCVFWCEAVWAGGVISSIYQIAAVRIRDGQAAGSFHSYIRTIEKDGIKTRQKAAETAGIDVSVLDNAETVPEVIKKFFEFVGSDVLVSTGALADQMKHLKRAARYSGMNGIDNEFLDLLDYAEDISEKFSGKQYSRRYLLAYFGIHEGNNAIEKAEKNEEIIKKIKELP